MTSFRHPIIGLVLMLMTPLTQAASDAIVELGSRLRALGSYQADFLQISELSGGQRKETVHGQLSVQRPDRFRWVVSSPYQQTIVSDGRDVRIHDPDLMQMTVRPLDKAWGQTPALLFSGDAAGLAREFTVTRTGQGTVTTYQLTPRAKDAVFANVQLSFKGEQPDSLALQDSLGQKTRIVFSQGRLNASLPASAFTLKPPPGTDVIRE